VQNFQILILAAVKVCKQCLQTASASGRQSPPDLIPGLHPWTPVGEFCRSDTQGYSPSNENYWCRHCTWYL